MPYVFEKDREAFNAFQKARGKPELDSRHWTHESHWYNFTVARASTIDASRADPGVLTTSGLDDFSDSASAAISLCYNHVIRASVASPLEEGQVARPLQDGEELVFQGLYQERTGYLTRMTYAFPEYGGEQRHGFYFRGDNGIAYKKNGSTTLDDSSGLNDITAVIETVTHPEGIA